MANVDSQRKKMTMICFCVMLFFTYTASVPIGTGSTVTQSPSSTTTLQTDNGQIGSSLTNISMDKNVLSENDHKVQDTNGGVVKQLISGIAEKKNNTETATSKQNIENKETVTSRSVIMPFDNLSTKKTFQESAVFPGESSVTTRIKFLKDTESESHLFVGDVLSNTHFNSYNSATDRNNYDDETTSTVSTSSTTSTTTTQSTSSTVTMTTSKQGIKKTSSASVADIWRSDWDDDNNENEKSYENEKSEKNTDEDDDWNIVEDGKDDSLIPVGYQTDDENDIADKFGDFWDERAFNQRPYIKEGLVTLIPDREERKIENEISMITYYSWILFFTFLLITVFVFFRQRHIFSAYWSWSNGPRTRHSSGSEEGKSLMKNVYA